MADFPALPLWTDAYLADTRHLSTFEHGAYMLLLMEAWRRPSCALPDDDMLLCRLSGMDRADWMAIKQTVMAFWTLTPSGWVQKRLRKERKYVAEKALKQRQRALNGWNKRKSGDAVASDDECPTDAPTPTPTPNRIEAKASRDLLGDLDAPKLQNIDDLEEAVQLWNLFADGVGLARVQRLTDTRRASLRKRLKEIGGLDGWRTALEYVGRSDFLLGRKPGSEWRADFDFLLQAKSMTKLMEGGFAPTRPGGSRGSAAMAELRRMSNGE